MQSLEEITKWLAVLDGYIFHPNAKKNEFTLKRHKSFVYSHLIGAMVALAFFPLYLYRSGGVSLEDIGILLLFTSPFFTVAYLKFSGSLAGAHLISALTLTVFVTLAAAFTGGLQSFLLGWMIIVPLEAALSGRRSVIMAAIMMAIGSLIGLYFAGQYGLTTAHASLSYSIETLALFGLFTATSYGGAIAMSVQQLHEDSESAVRASERRYRLMAENATDMISVLDDRGQAVFASPSAKPLTGLSADELMQSGIINRIHVSDRPLYMTAISNCLSAQRPVTVEFRVRCAPDSDTTSEQNAHPTYRWLEMRCRAVPNALNDGELQIVAVTRDISNHKDQEITLLKARDEAESANIAKTRFLANMSHELRTPLNAIIGFSDVLNLDLYGKLENQKHADYARLINEAGTHLLSVVNNILDMSKIEVGKFSITPEPFDLRPLITGCCDMIEPVASEKGVIIRQIYETDLGYIHADSRALKQMMINLLSNAIKFSHQGGLISVTTKLEDEAVTIDVEDQGIGISDEDLPKLCNPFVQADSSYKREHEGVGLGLSVVKGLAELHGGALKIKSKLGVGTRARIELPVNASLTSPETSPMQNESASNAVVIFNKKDKSAAQAG